MNHNQIELRDAWEALRRAKYALAAMTIYQHYYGNVCELIGQLQICERLSVAPPPHINMDIERLIERFAAYPEIEAELCAAWVWLNPAYDYMPDDRVGMHPAASTDYDPRYIQALTPPLPYKVFYVPLAFEPPVITDATELLVGDFIAAGISRRVAAALFDATLKNLDELDENGGGE